MFFYFIFHKLITSKSINRQLSLCSGSLVRIAASCNGLLLLTGQKKKELIYHVLKPSNQRDLLPPELQNWKMLSGVA